MKKDWDPQRLDVRAFARLSGAFSGSTPLSELARLQAEQDVSGREAAPVQWSLSGQIRDLRGGAHQTWMQVQAQTTLHMICQRCLEPMTMPLWVDRHFRFVSSEQAAAAEDDQAEEDLLVASPQFDALTLIEDELILAMPLVPRHESCQSPQPSVGEIGA
jgi:uncharacterized protein